MNKKQLIFAAIVTTTLFQTTLPSDKQCSTCSEFYNRTNRRLDSLEETSGLLTLERLTTLLALSEIADQQSRELATLQAENTALKDRVTTLENANTALKDRVTNLENPNTALAKQKADRKRLKQQQAFRNRIILGTLGLASTAGVAYTFRDQLKSCSNPFSGFSNCFSGITRFFGRN